MNIHELANRIRDKVDLDFSHKVTPERRHLHDTAVGVAGVLGMDANALNVGHLMGLLATQTEQPAYPKMKYRRGPTGVEQRIVHSADEEKALGDDWADHHSGEVR